MKRSLLLGLAWLALLVAPLSEGTAQTPSNEPAPREAEPAADAAAPPLASPVAEPSGPANEISPVDVTAATPSPMLRSSDAELDVQGSAFLASDDLAPNASIVTDGQPLAIEEAVAMSIRNNLNVEVERYGPLIAEANAASFWGAYDPTVSGDATYDVAKAINVNPFNAARLNRDRTEGGSIGVNQLFPYLGAALDARFTSNSVATRSTFARYDPQYNTSFFLTATVPLLRNVVWNQNWTNVKLSGAQSEAAEENFRQVLMDNVQNTVNSYWGLVASRDRVRVAQKSLETARALLDQTRTQYEVGVVSQVEVVEAEAGVANREFELIKSANDYRNAQDILIDLVLGPELKPLTDLQVVPTADLTTQGRVHIDVEGSVTKAFENRPELKVAKNAIEQSEINLKFAKSQRLPQFDVVGRYGYVGIGGRPNANYNPAFGPNTSPKRDYSNSMDGYFQGNGPDNYRVQGLLSVPIPNTRGRELVSRGEFDLRRSQTSLIRLEQKIILDIRAASRTLIAAMQGIEAAERRRLAAEEQLRAERIRLEHGESTPFEVLQRQEDLVEAESQKINALQSFHAAETGLARAQGTILEAHAVEVDAVRVPAR
jgi:outer membrane protein TolC